MNEDQEIEIVDTWIKRTSQEIMSVFVERIQDFPDDLFTKYSSALHVYLLTYINTAIMDGFAKTAYEAGSQIMAQPDEAFYYLLKTVMELTTEHYLIKQQSIKEGAH